MSIAQSLMTTAQVAELCLVSEARIKQLLKTGRIKPAKRYPRLLLFTPSDAQLLRKSLAEDSRSNLSKSL